MNPFRIPLPGRADNRQNGCASCSPNGFAAALPALAGLLLGATIFSAAAAGEIGEMVILDNGSPGTFQEGSWESINNSDCYGADALKARRTGSYTFSAALDPGTYRIYLWWVATERRSKDVPVTIHAATGDSIVSVNQRRSSKRWNLIGEFQLDDSASVTLMVPDGRYVCADAVMFELVSQPLEPLPDLPPAAPLGLTASAGEGFIDLDWDDNSEPDLAGYNLYRSTSPAGEFPLLASGLLPSGFQDTAVTPGTTYFYAVTAVDGAGNESDASDPVSAAPLDPFPQAPVGLSAVGGDSMVGLDWVDNTETDLAGYNIYRSADSLNNFLQIASGLKSSAYQDRFAVISPGTIYHYLVTAFDTGGHESEPSAMASAAPIDAPPAAPAGLAAAAGDGFVDLDWQDSLVSDLASYSVYRSTISGSGFELLASGLAASAFKDTSAANGTTYYYAVTAVDLGGNESNLSAQASASPTTANNFAALDWEPPVVNADGTPLDDLAGYRIYMGTAPGFYTKVADAGNLTTFTFNDLSPATYYFAVTAYDTSGNESVFSNEVLKTIP